MLKAAMSGTGIDQMSGAEHPDAAQPLKSLVIDEGLYPLCERNISQLRDSNRASPVGVEGQFRQRNASCR